jgi:hypothetical protein
LPPKRVVRPEPAQSWTAFTKLGTLPQRASVNSLAQLLRKLLFSARQRQRVDDVCVYRSPRSNAVARADSLRAMIAELDAHRGKHVNESGMRC